MFNYKIVVFIGLFFTFSVNGQTPDNPEIFKEEIENFQKADEVQQPEAGGIVFTGSSSIRGWRSLKQDFPDKLVINRGFGGSRIGDATYYFDDIIGKYYPKQVVFYSGENDIAAGKTAEETLSAFMKFYEKFNKKLPNAELIFISIKPSPSRWNLFEEMQRANSLIKNYIEEIKNVKYVDITKGMLTDENSPKDSIFLGDKLHMNSEGYEIWTAILEGHLVD